MFLQKEQAERWQPIQQHIPPSFQHIIQDLYAVLDEASSWRRCRRGEADPLHYGDGPSDPDMTPIR